MPVFNKLKHHLSEVIQKVLKLSSKSVNFTFLKIKIGQSKMKQNKSWIQY